MVVGALMLGVGEWLAGLVLLVVFSGLAAYAHHVLRRQ